MKPDSEYLFVEVAAQRCLQLMRGAKPKIDSSAPKYTSLAVREVEQDLIPWEIGPAEEEAEELAAAAEGDEAAATADAEEADEDDSEEE